MLYLFMTGTYIEIHNTHVHRIIEMRLSTKFVDKHFLIIVIDLLAYDSKLVYLCERLIGLLKCVCL